MKDWPKDWKLPKRLQGLPLNIHLGCGLDQPEDWLNVDARAIPGVDLVARINDLSIPDACAESVVMRHVLEHFAVLEVPMVLEEVRRILKPGGILEITTPDHEAYMKVLEPAQWNHGWQIWAERFYGGQDYEFNFHKCCFAEKFLPELMSGAGFQLEEAYRVERTNELRWISKKVVRSGMKALFWERGTHNDVWLLEMERLFQAMGWDTKRMAWYGDYMEETKLKELQQLFATWKPDMFYAFPAWEGGPTKRIMQFIRAQEVLCVAWSHDEPYRFDGFDKLTQRVAPWYDIWFTNWGTNVHLREWHRRGVDVRYLPCSALPYMQRDAEAVNASKRYDIGFIGTYYQPREEYLLAVADMELNLWMGRRDAPDPTAWPPPAELLKRMAGAGVPHHLTAKIINQTKINIDISEQPDGRVRCAKTRLFEITNCGGFALSGRCPAVLRHFREGRDIECYDTAEELREKAIYYLLHRDERERIAENGWRVAMEQHTYQHRAATISQAAREELVKRQQNKARLSSDPITVVILAKEGLSLQQAVESVGDSIPVMVVDAGDGELLKSSEEWRRQSLNVSYVKSPEPHSGLAGAANFGASMCSTPYVLFLNENDCMFGGWASVVRYEIAKGADVVVGATYTIDALSQPLTSGEAYLGATCVSRTAFQAVGGFDESYLEADVELFGREMQDFLNRIQAAGFSVHKTESLICHIKGLSHQESFGVESPMSHSSDGIGKSAQTKVLFITA